MAEKIKELKTPNFSKDNNKKTRVFTQVIDGVLHRTEASNKEEARKIFESNNKKK